MTKTGEIGQHLDAMSDQWLESLEKELAAVEWGSRDGFTEVSPLLALRLVRSLREARRIIAFMVRTLDDGRAASRDNVNPALRDRRRHRRNMAGLVAPEVIFDQKRAEDMLRAFLACPGVAERAEPERCPHGLSGEAAAWCLDCEDDALKKRRGGKGSSDG